MINEKEPAENMSAETERQLSFIDLARADYVRMPDE